jgi:hypothetical protein
MVTRSAIIASNANADVTNKFAPDAGAAYVFTRSDANNWTTDNAPEAGALYEF